MNSRAAKNLAIKMAKGASNGMKKVKTKLSAIAKENQRKGVENIKMGRI